MNISIKTRFALTIWVTVALLLLGTISAGIGMWHTKAALKASIKLDTLVINLYELRILSLECEINPSERAQRQWQIQYEMIRRSVADIPGIPGEVSDAFVNVKKIFERITSMDTESVGKNVLHQRVKDQLFTALHIESQRIIDWALDISDESRNSFFAGARNYDIGTVAILMLVAAITTYVIFVTGNYILTSIIMLKNGTDKIAHGELNHRIELPGTDEMSKLAGAFNSMSQDLQNSYAEMTLTNRLLQESEMRYRALFEQSGDYIIVMKIAKGGAPVITDVNEMALYAHGYSREEILDQPITFLDPYTDFSVHDERIKVLREGALEIFTAQHRRRDGSVFDVEVRAQLVRIGGEQFIVSSERDITERRRTEAALIQSEMKYRELVETANSVILTWDAQGNITFLNKYAEQFFGFSKDELLGKNVVGTIVPQMESSGRDLALLMEEIRKDPDRFRDNENENITRDGRRVWIRWANKAIEDNEGRLVGILSIGNDITQRKRAEEKLRQSEEFVKNILDSVDEGFIVVDREFRILTVNKAYCGQVGGTCDNIIGKYCYAISHKASRPCYEEGEDCAVRQVFETGEPHVALHRHIDAKGAVLFVETKAFPIRDNSGAVTSVIETVNDITGKHLLEEERLKTQKLEAIGTLAGGIAHDFNNLLQGIFGYISMAKMSLENREISLTMLQQAENALHMSVGLTSQLLTFSKGGKPVKKMIGLRHLIENSLKFALSGSRSSYTFKADSGLWMAEADEGQIGQVIQNIVLNADQAMPTGGTVEVTAKKFHSPAKGPHRILPKGNYIEISVKDNGIGIPEHYLSRIFDPYFTTKEKGSGLGLATSYSIIKNHGGVINVRTEMGKGSVVSFYLPAVEEEEEKEKAEAISGDPPVYRKGRILVMDDEELVRNIVGIMIKSLGHEVEFAENGEEAIAKYREALLSNRVIDVVILDLTIRGGKGGEETLRELLRIDPAAKAVVSSGYSDSSAISEYETHGFRACLAKPYEFAELRKTLTDLLK